VLGAGGQALDRRCTGAEASAFAGLGWAPTRQGILLARRGWVLSDFLSGANSRLPLGPDEGFTHVFDERDGRPAIYAGGSVADPAKIATLHAGYFDNLGNLDVSGVWETRYGIGGIVLDAARGARGDGTVSSIGSTTTAWCRAPERDQRVLPDRVVSLARASPRRSATTISGFATRTAARGTDESGNAYTIAYLLELGLRHRIAAEYVWVKQAIDRDVSDPGTNGFQVSYRFRY
jgi:hypothetical protein